MFPTTTDAQKSTTNSGWMTDLGTTSYITYDANAFELYVSKECSNVIIGNDHKLKCSAEGTVRFDLTVNEMNRKLMLYNVAHISGLQYHLMSVFAMCEAQYKVVLENSQFLSTKTPRKLLKVVV